MLEKLLSQIVALLVEVTKEVKKQTLLLEEVHAATVKGKEKTLADYAEGYLGTDASPADIAPDELGCAESVSMVIRRVLPDFKIETATWLLKEKLDADKRFERVTEAARGVVILSPTYSGNGSVVGHVGIFGDTERIMSNSSASGTWEYNYTLQKWVGYYRDKGGLKIYYYRLK